MTAEQAQKLQTAARTDNLATLFMFNLLTGCRPSETFALEWSDFDFDARTVQIQRTLHWRTKKRGAPIVFRTSVRD